MKISKPHSFSAEDAAARLRALTTYWDTKYGTRTSWTGNSARIQGKVKGIKFDGTFNIGDSSLDADVKVGFLAEKMGGRGYVEHKVEQYLDPNTPVESLKTS